MFIVILNDGEAINFKLLELAAVYINEECGIALVDLENLQIIGFNKRAAELKELYISLASNNNEHLVYTKSKLYEELCRLASDGDSDTEFYLVDFVNNKVELEDFSSEVQRILDGWEERERSSYR